MIPILSLSVYLHPDYSGLSWNDYCKYTEIRNQLGVVSGKSHTDVATKILNKIKDSVDVSKTCKRNLTNAINKWCSLVYYRLTNINHGDRLCFVNYKLPK